MVKEVFDLNNCEWKENPIVFIAGLLVVYTAGNSIMALFNL
ncbi:hypothetical protein [Pelosinus sp. HCF1]|jgi:alpha-D-ribose 1-methylphosphonate 5-triphosphate synthase subunit PhnH|nr:hypothetical protein [Pelosinus sp. HCF1]